MLDVLKTKMRQTKEEMEKYKEECEDLERKLKIETGRREESDAEVSSLNRRIQLLEQVKKRTHLTTFGEITNSF